MKKIRISILMILMLLLLLFTSEKVDASENTVIDRVHIELDVPVNGVALKKSARVYEFVDSKNMEMKEANTASKVYDIYWYKTTEPGKVLADGYKAKLGESYLVTVVLQEKDGYEFIDNLYTKNNLLNGKSADVFIGAKPNGDEVWLFESTLTTIPAANGKPVVVVKDMELAPYEGNPMEIVIDVTNATNVKYQWQIVYGDDDGWSGEVDLDDNAAYRGTKTDHFKIHSYFGDTFDEDLNFAKIQCKVTSDNGTAYSQQVWYTLRDRQMVNGFSLTGLNEPKIGETPDYNINSADSSKYYVKKVIWYGPKTTDGTYPEMSGNSTFKAGEYSCKIIVSTTDSYKIDDSYYGSVNGKKYVMTVVHGKDSIPYGPDSYYVNVPFTVSEISLDRLSAIVADPAVGVLPGNAISDTKGVVAAETEWSKVDSRGRYIELKEGETFEAGTTYRCSVCMQLETGYTFAPIFESYINGKAAKVGMLKGEDYRWIEYHFVVEKEDTDEPDVPDIPVNPFTDVKESDYFYEPVLWAVENGITAGLTDTVFGPDNSCTRAQAVTFMWRNAGEPEPKSNNNPFVDVKENAYYYKAVLWAVENGITSGKTATTFCPKENCTRAQIVTFLWRSEGKEMIVRNNPFSDVKESDYYYNAVLWAVENGITSGKTATTFGPKEDCTRAQIVTFLYRNAFGD